MQIHPYTRKHVHSSTCNYLYRYYSSSPSSTSKLFSMTLINTQPSNPPPPHLLTTPSPDCSAQFYRFSPNLEFLVFILSLWSFVSIFLLLFLWIRWQKRCSFLFAPFHCEEYPGATDYSNEDHCSKCNPNLNSC